MSGWVYWFPIEMDRLSNKFFTAEEPRRERHLETRTFREISILQHLKDIYASKVQNSLWRLVKNL